MRDGKSLTLFCMLKRMALFEHGQHDIRWNLGGQLEKEVSWAFVSLVKLCSDNPTQTVKNPDGKLTHFLRHWLKTIQNTDSRNVHCSYSCYSY